MTTKTYPQLGTLASVHDGDLIAGWRAGPLVTYTASIVRTYMSALSLPLTGGTMTGPLLLANGSEGAPSLSFGSETGTGIYRSGAGELDISILGTRRLGLTASGLNVYGTATAVAFSGPLNGTVGATTPASGAFTTLAASGATVLSSTLAVTGASTLTGGYGAGLATKTADYTLVAADAGKTLQFITNTGLTLTIPLILVDGWRVKVINRTGGTLAIANGSGATVEFEDGLSSPIANATSFVVIGNADKPLVTR